MWCVYILLCKDGSFYVGSTDDISRRVKEHNAGKGGVYIAARRPLEIIYQEACPGKSSARIRENQIKRWSRKKKVALISRNKPLLKELSQSRD